MLFEEPKIWISSSWYSRWLISCKIPEKILDEMFWSFWYYSYITTVLNRLVRRRTIKLTSFMGYSNREGALIYWWLISQMLAHIFWEYLLRSAIFHWILESMGTKLSFKKVLNSFINFFCTLFILGDRAVKQILKVVYNNIHLQFQDIVFIRSYYSCFFNGEVRFFTL